MSATTPYDADRSPFSRRALARLALSRQAAGVSDAAGSLVVTRYDRFAGPGSRVSEAVAVAGYAEELVTRAVVFERERGSSWAEIGRYLELSADAAEQRFAPAVRQWRTAFEVPYRLDATGRKRIPQLPSAAYDPARAIRSLDLWASSRVGYHDEHAVSGALQPGDEDEVGPQRNGTRIDGWLRREHVDTFLDLLSEYVRHTPGGPWAGETSFVMDGVFTSLGIHLSTDGDRVSVGVDGAHSPDLRVRISTLLDVFGGADD